MVMLGVMSMMFCTHNSFGYSFPVTTAGNCQIDLTPGSTMWCDFTPAINIGHTCGMISGGNCVCTEPDGDANICHSCKRGSETANDSCYSCPAGYALNGSMCENLGVTEPGTQYFCQDSIISDGNVWCDFTPAITVGHTCGYMAPGSRCMCTQPDGILNECSSCRHSGPLPEGKCHSAPGCPSGYTLYSESCLNTNSNLGDVSSCHSENQLIGNPVNAGVGNKYQSEVDYSGNHSAVLRLTRHYNSQSIISSAFGKNWSVFGVLQPHDAEHLVMTQADGKWVEYTRAQSGWSANTSISRTLSSTVSGHQLLLEDGSLETYTAAGQLLSISEPSGRTQTLAYDGSGRLQSITDSHGRQLIFTHDSSDRIATVTNPAGSLIHYAYDALGNLATVTYPDDTPSDTTDDPVRTYHYEDSRFPHALTGITDENGDRYATWAYDEQGRAILSEHAGGADRVGLTYNADGTTSVTDALGTSRNYGFETVLGVVKGTGISQPGGAGCGASNSAITHDANGNVTTRDDFNGHRTRHWYDLSRNLETRRVEGLAVKNGSEVVEPETRTITTEWHPIWRLPTVEKTYSGGADSAGVPQGTMVKEVNWAYDDHGNLLTHTERDSQRGESRTWTYTWHTLGRIASADGPRTDVQDITIYAYYPDEDPDLARRGQLWRSTNALGHVTEIQAYDLHGHPLRVRDPNGLITEYTYTARGWLKTRLVGDRLTTYTYDKVGQLIRVDLPDGARLEYTYDAAHRLTDIRNAWGDHIHYTLDLQGNIRSETVKDIHGNQAGTLSREFDALGRLWKEVRLVNGQSAVTEYGYDAQGNRTLRTDPLAHVTQWRHDALDRLAQTEDAMHGLVERGYDAQDQMTFHRAPKGDITSYEVDAFGQVRMETSPDRGITTYTYDPAGNLKTRTDALGKTITYSYDTLNRLVLMDRQTGVDTILYWDMAPVTKGRLARMQHEAGETRWTYSPFGEIIGKTQVHTQNGSWTRNVNYEYFQGNLSHVTYPSGAGVDYVWNQGRITEVRLNGAPLLTNIQYQAFGGPKSWTWGNGRGYTRDFDWETGWPRMLDLGDRFRLIDYDPAGRIIAFPNSLPSQNQYFDYDALDRLTSQTTHQGNTGWAYDNNGNRTQQQSGTATYLYAYSPVPQFNRLLSLTGPVPKTYQYDPAGNVIHDGTYAFTYNDYGRLNRLTWNGQTTTYLYDGLGQRVQKTGRGATNGLERYVHDEAGKLLGEYTPTGTRLRETIWLYDQPVAVITANGTLLYVYADHLNAPRVLTNTGNMVVWRWDGDAFGVGAASEDPDGDGTMVRYNLRFPGQFYDVESGLHYNINRYYDPRTGRYPQFDPIGLAGGINGYGYANQNPLTYTDPLGLTSIVFDPVAHTQTIYDGAGEPVGTFPAGNNAQRGSRGNWDPGIYTFSYYVPHIGGKVDGPYGSNGNFVFNVPGCSGCGVHSGRQDKCDRAGRCGVEHATNGCIRTMDQATQLLQQLLDSGDPLKTLIVLPK